MSESTRAVTAGIDVGGPKKGFHAVALKGGNYLAKFASPDPAALLAWCREVGAVAVGVDARARWSETGKMRPCERALAQAGISCFATPTLAQARKIAFHGWMLNGAALYAVLETAYALFDGTQPPGAKPLCFETFPQAIACALAGEAVSAKRKGTVRRALLSEAGVALGLLTNIDTVDAALCALSAHHLLAGRVAVYGEAQSGVIVIPDLNKKKGRR